jgi:hypothetical protein
VFEVHNHEIQDTFKQSKDADCQTDKQYVLIEAETQTPPLPVASPAILPVPLLEKK